MPSSFSSTFASAAAGNTNNEAGPNGRDAGRGDGSGDWSRARTNGATQTFRRPSLGTSLSHQKDVNAPNNSFATPGTGVYVPPHLNSSYQPSFGRNGGPAESRYSKDQLLNLFRAQYKSEQVTTNVAEYLVEGWNPDIASTATNGRWAGKDGFKDGTSGPEICWDYEGVSHPLGLNEMGDDEREAFTTSVNSPLKGPSQPTNKESTPSSATVGRRTSLSHAQNLMGAYTANSPTSIPGNRRRESSDVIQTNLLASPIGNSRFFKDDPNVSSPPPSLLRRRTDFKENTSGSGLDDKDEDNPKLGPAGDTVFPFGPLKRTLTGPAGAGVNGPSSPWSATPQSAGFSPMGTFGNFSLGGSSGQPFSPIDKKPAFSSFRGESRFKGLMNQENSEESTPKIKEKSSLSSLEKLTEATNEPTFTDWPVGSTRRPQGEGKYVTGSAALGGDDASPPAQRSSRTKPAETQVSYDDIGFSSLGLSSDMPNLREVMQRREYPPQNTMHSQTQNYLHANEPMSPTNTNPFQSPEGEKAIHEDFDMDESELHNTHLVNARPFSHHARGFPNQHEGTASDRSQTSSVGAPRSYPNLGALGGLAGMSGAGAWSAGPGAIGTPTRTLPGQPAGFGDPIFSTLGDFTSPTHNANVSGPGTSIGHAPTAIGNAGPLGRGGKMGSLFPSAMQDQMRGESSRQESGFGDGNEFYQRNLNNTSAPGFASGLRDTDSPARSGRGTLDDLFGNLDIRNRHLQGTNTAFGSGGNESMQASSSQIPTSILSQQSFPAISNFIGSPSIASPPGGAYFSRSQDQDATPAISNQMPASQQRQMVMPDRMRWIYRDPQGHTQGPWSGLEMHDWYKAGFFSPELQVKKLEDADYEPLAQLIRRIGNSREPFLVPQIGIPHGSVAGGPASASGTGSATTPSALQTSAAQPPFPSSFPSFGTTLTAEQQNALERRKQEEQYLMARQKEHLAQQQVMIKQMQHMQGAPHGLHSQQLHHHSSAHSLHSQPSYGSITSPTGYQPTPTQGPIQVPPAVPGFFDPRNMVSNLAPLGGGSEALGPVREDEVTGIIDRLNTGRGAQIPFSGPSYHPSQPEGMSHSQQVAAMLQERARLQHEQEQYDLLQRGTDDHRGTSERLEQFHMLRTQLDEQQQPSGQPGYMSGHTGRPAADSDHLGQQQRKESTAEPREQIQSLPPPKAPERPSLSEQVQKAAALAKHSPNIPPPSPWTKVDAGLPQPFPPPQSSSPLPAPAAQRNRQNVAETLSAESRSRSQTPSVETPNTTIAPWAKDLTDPSKGPSLKEIQAIEARNAAQQEEIAAAARRAAAEQERQNQIPSAAPTPGLPSSANWASSVSPAIPIGTGTSVWTKPVAGKGTAIAANPSAKKTLAQIQKEEEARKTRAAASAAAANAAANSSNMLAMTSGKRYADLAGKTTNLPSPGGNSAWTTVGAGGKAKVPAAPALNLSSRITTTSAQPTAPAKPKVSNATRGGLGGSISNQQTATDEFQKWTKSALGNGLNAGIPVDDFVSQLLMLPAEPDIISDSIYASSQTLDGRRFAEEFVRRRKLADKGIVPDSGSGTNAAGGFFSTPGESKGGSATGGGWSEVAKKASSSSASGNNGSSGDGTRGESFMVVKGKRKGKK